ncbi:MAG: HlyD family secretion protein [Hyphomicrobium sp.]
MLKKLNSAVTPITTVAAVALVLGYAVTSGLGRRSAALAQTPTTTAAPAQWAASATGRVEPKDGEVRVASQTPGRIMEVLAKTNDQVKTGDLLVRLDDQEIYVKIAAALAEVGVREREREEEKATGLALERRQGEDAVSRAERAVFAARESFDAAQRVFRSNGGSPETVNVERAKVNDAIAKLATERASLSTVNSKVGMPLTQRLESSLTSSRAELSSAEIALERTRVRAPADGTVLNMIAKVGETAVPSPDSALLVFGDLTSLRLRAEVEERDAAKVRVGQKVVVKADAFPDQSFDGTVTSISQSLGQPRIATRGPRRPNDVEVVEVMVSLDGNPPLFTGMRVDTFFKRDDAANSAPSPATKTN